MDFPQAPVTSGAPVGLAVAPGSGTLQQTSSTYNNFKPNQQLKFTITNGAAGDVTDQIIVAGAGDTESTLTALVTISSSSLGGSTAAARLANLRDYFGKVGLKIAGIKVSTTDPDNFDGQLTIGERNPNGNIASENQINFDDYRQANGSNIDNVFKVNDGKQMFTNNPMMRWKLTQLKVGTSVTITLDIPENSRNQSTTAIDY